MPNNDFVVYNPNTGLYLVEYHELDDNHDWGSAEKAKGYATLSAAEDIATNIGSGTVGTSRPS